MQAGRPRRISKSLKSAQLSLGLKAPGVPALEAQVRFPEQNVEAPRPPRSRPPGPWCRPAIHPRSDSRTALPDKGAVVEGYDHRHVGEAEGLGLDQLRDAADDPDCHQNRQIRQARRYPEEGQQSTGHDGRGQGVVEGRWRSRNRSWPACARKCWRRRNTGSRPGRSGLRCPAGSAPGCTMIRTPANPTRIADQRRGPTFFPQQRYRQHGHENRRRKGDGNDAGQAHLRVGQKMKPMAARPMPERRTWLTGLLTFTAWDRPSLKIKNPSGRKAKRLRKNMTWRRGRSRPPTSP